MRLRRMMLDGTGRVSPGQMVLRRIAAGMGEAAKQFRRVNGHLYLPALRATLDATINAVTPSKEDAA
jgi:putative transposase